MSKKRRGTIPQTRAKLNPEIFNLYTLDQVCGLLNGYLSGEVEIDSMPERTYAKAAGPKKNVDSPFSVPLNPTEELIASIGCFGHQIMIKHSKGETPPPDRMSLWAVCLRIADKLEQEGALPECVEETRIAGGYSFTCRIYRTEKLGSICIPGLPGEKVDSEDTVGGLAYDADSYNALVSNRRARVIIKQFTDTADW